LEVSQIPVIEFLFISCVQADERIQIIERMKTVFKVDILVSYQ